MTIGDRIKEKRLSQGKTLEYVASIVNVGRATIHKYENNIITKIPSDRIELLANALDTTPAYLLGWDEDKKSTAAELASGIRKQLIDYASDLTEEQAALALRVLKSIVESEEQ